MGNAAFGNDRQELDPGDYLAQVTDVRLDEVDDFKDKTKKKSVFRFSVDLQMPDGDWQTQTLFTSRTITDMSPRRDGKPPPAKFVSTLNKLIRACGKQVPQSREAVEAWDEESLVSCQFIWRVVDEEDEETGQITRVRKFLPKRAEAAPEKPKAAPVAEADDDPFVDQEAA